MVDPVSPRADRLVCLIYWVCIVAGCLRGHQLGHWSALHLFGWEYGNIAESLVRGEGFAGAMCRGSGPTAWMPPLLAWIYALIFWIFGIRTQAAIGVAYFCKSGAMALSLYLLLRLLARSGWGKGRPILAGFAFLFLGLDELRVFYELEDVWLQNLSVCVALHGLFDLNAKPRLSAATLLSALLLPLVSPISCAAFHLCSLAIALRRRGGLRPVVVALGISFAVSGAWTLRNLAVLGRAYPIKSNVWFDYVEANLWDDDGVVTDSIFFRYHPVNPNSKQDQYRILGERVFLEHYQLEASRVELGQWLRRCGRRLTNAAVYLEREIDVVGAVGLSVPDQCQLHYAGLLAYSRGQPLWQFCNWDEATLYPLLAKLPLQDRAAVLRSRATARSQYQQLYQNWVQQIWSLAHAGLVSLAILSLMLRSRRQDGLVVLAVGYYLAYMLPYILVSHYERYQVCVTGLQMLLLTLALARRSS